MRFPLFIVAAVVLVVFGIIAAAGSSGFLFGTGWQIWFMASFLAYLADLLFGWGWDNRSRFGNRTAPPPPPPAA